MKYLLIILAVFSFSFSCKTKKAIVPHGPIKDTLIVEEPETGNLNMLIKERPETPDGDWVLNKVNNKFDAEMKRVSMKLNTNEKLVSGNDACNQYSGPITKFDETKIVFGPMASTKRACIVPAKFAKALYKNLEQVTNYSFTSFGLSLKDTKGNVLLYFSKDRKK